MLERPRWINICPYPGKQEIKPVPPPVKHMRNVKHMVKNRIPISGLKVLNIYR